MQAWERSPLETLQLVAHLRDVREGKGESRCGSDAYIWLAHYHPRTLIVNLPEVVKVLPAATPALLLPNTCAKPDMEGTRHSRHGPD